jgi:pilus assembly protein Flp/PilA
LPIEARLGGTNCRNAMVSIKALPSKALNMFGTDLAHDLRILIAYSARQTESMRMKQLFKEFIADESGATAIEYGLIAAGISLAIIAVVNGLGTKLNSKFTSINASLK